MFSYTRKIFKKPQKYENLKDFCQYFEIDCTLFEFVQFLSKIFSKKLKKNYKKMQSTKKHSPIRSDITTEKNGNRHIESNVTFDDA